MSQKAEKVQDVLDIFEFGEEWKFDAPPSALFGKNLKLGKFRILGTPLKKRNISLKHLKLLQHHLFFVQLKYLDSTFTFGKKMKIWPPPLLSKSPHF